jgi:hypothetical protein
LSVKTISFFAVIAAFMFALTAIANAQFTVTGKVVSINDSSKIITIEPVRDARFAGSVSFGLTRTDPYDRNTVRMADIRDMSDKSIRLSDIHEGDWVTITYHQESTGQLVAEGIAVSGAAVPRGAVSGTYPESRAPMTHYPDQYRTEAVPHRTEAVPLSITGKVIAIDKFAKTFTLDPSFGRNVAADKAALGLRTFALDRNGLVLIGNERRDFNDLTIGDLVTVNYRQESTGKIMADHITLVPPYPGPQASALMPHMVSPSQQPLARDRMMDNRSFAAETTPFALQGKVLAVDRNAGTITVDSSFRDIHAYNKGKGGVTTFVLDKDISVFSGNRSLGLGDIKVGDTVSINYHQESDGNIIADSIAITPLLVPFPEERG